MKPLAFILSLSIANISFGQTTDKMVSWYKCMKGTIGKYPVTMHIHKWENNYTGYYYYDRSQQPLHVSGVDSPNKKVGLSAHLPGPNESEESFIGNWSADTLKGLWRANKKGAPLPFALTVARDSTVPNFTLVYTKGSVKLRPTMKKSPEANFFASSIWPVTQTPSTGFLKKQLLEVLGGKTDIEIGRLLLNHKKSFFDEYKSDFKDATDKDITEYGMSYNYESQSTVCIVYSSPKLLTVSSNTYSYMGGAHGMYGTSFDVFDLTRKRRLELKDVLNQEDSVTLNILLEEKFRKVAGLKATEKLSEVLFEDYISASDNFFVTGKGIGFHYNPYDIAAYVFGEITLFIPFSEVSSMIKPEFLTLIE